MERIFFFPSSVSGFGGAGLTGKEVLGLGVRGLEDVVPIVLGGTEAAKRGVQSDHLCSHSITGGVGIKTTIDDKALG